MLRFLLCTIIGHRVNRRRVWNDGLNLRGGCRFCRFPMIRTQEGWRAFDSERDASPTRKPHPRAK